MQTFITVLSCCLTFSECAKLLKKPKVYNAIITTDEELSPSRAYPIYHHGIPIIPFSISNRNDVFDEQKVSVRVIGLFSKITLINAIMFVKTQRNDIDRSEISKPTESNNDDLEETLKHLPSLIPLQQVPNYHLAYPFVYDSFGNFQAIPQFPVLPPTFYPSEEKNLPPIEQPLFQVGSRRFDHPQNAQVEKSQEDRERANAAIKNNSFNINSEIPDVPFPPIPFKKSE